LDRPNILDKKRQLVSRSFYLQAVFFYTVELAVIIDKPLLGNYWMNYGVLAVAGGPARAYLMSKVFVVSE
jgi:hypothetical protein